MKIAVMPGDGIGKEVTEQAVLVLHAVMGPHAAMELIEAPVGQAGVDAAGDPLPVQTREIANKADAILGKVTNLNVVKRLAPKSMLASSKDEPMRR